MKKVSLSLIIMLILLIVALAACTTAADEPNAVGQQTAAQEEAPETVFQSDTPEPAPTSSPTPKPTETATPEPSKTPTPSPTPSPTDTLQPTSTPTATPEPPSTPTRQPDLTVVAESINIRNGPGTNYETLGAAAQGEDLAVSGQVSECQWLQVETVSGDSGWVTGSSEYVSLNLACSTIPTVDAPAPPIDSATQEPTAPGPVATVQGSPAGGTGRITVINETPGRGASVNLRTCCERIQISVEPGETKVVDLPADEYGWGAMHHNCVRDLPQLFLTAGMEVVVRFVPIETGCGMYLDITYLEA